MIHLTPEEAELLKLDAALLDAHDAALLEMAQNRFTAALDAIPDLHLRKIITYHNGVDAQFKYIPHECYEKWFCSKLYNNELELYTELAPVLENTTMANIFKMTGDMFKFMTAEMIPNGGDVVLTVDDVQIEELENQRGKEDKVIVHFKETDKGFVLGNKTNVRQMVALFGAETDEWIGVKVALYSTTIQAFGKTQPVIRIRDYHPKEAKKRAKRKPKATTSKEIKDMQTAVTDIDQEPLFTHEEADALADKGAY